MTACLSIVVLLAIGFLGGVWTQAYSQAPAAPPQVPQAAAPVTVPEWVVKYANNQETAARSCQVQLAQEQSKVDELTRDLANAKKAAGEKK